SVTAALSLFFRMRCHGDWPTLPDQLHRARRLTVPSWLLRCGRPALTMDCCCRCAQAAPTENDAWLCSRQSHADSHSQLRASTAGKSASAGHRENNTDTRWDFAPRSLPMTAHAAL